MRSVKLTKLIEGLNLRNATPDIDTTNIKLTVPDINRPALQLTGFYEHFASERVEIIGYVEYSYLMSLDREEKIKAYETLLAH